MLGSPFRIRRAASGPQPMQSDCRAWQLRTRNWTCGTPVYKDLPLRKVGHGFGKQVRASAALDQQVR